ncbi:hypothetical protein C0992_012539 [Termitomyces sp. T32_za158]|nr:hypothetical protein C0992_012539 [Termitomyces sp. T32_za158]
MRYYYESMIDYIEELRVDLSQVLDHPPGSSRTATDTAVASTPKPASRALKCSKCHARGHSDSACHSKDPTTVRRRIAANQKACGQHRLAGQLAAASIPSLPSLSPATPHPSRVFMATQDPAIVIAEAAELCRLAAQSTQDRRQARKEKSATSSHPT